MNKRALLCGLAAAIMLHDVHAADFGPQFTLLDLDSVWNRTTLTSGLTQPDNWNATGYDYLGGTFYSRLEIQDKPTDIEVLHTYCFWKGKAEVCSRQKYKIHLFKTEGVYYAITNPWDTWSLRKSEYEPFDGNGKLDKVLVQWWVMKDGKYYVLRNDERADVGHGYNERLGPEAEQHVPIDYRIELVIVAKGHKLTPPSHWEGYPDTWNASPVQVKAMDAREQISRSVRIVRSDNGDYRLSADPSVQSFAVYNALGMLMVGVNLSGKAVPAEIMLPAGKFSPGAYFIQSVGAGNHKAGSIAIRRIFIY